jgi:hypothetical protein
MKISSYTIYLEMQPNSLLVRQNFIICKKRVLHMWRLSRQGWRDRGGILDPRRRLIGVDHYQRFGPPILMRS